MMLWRYRSPCRRTDRVPSSSSSSHRLYSTSCPTDPAHIPQRAEGITSPSGLVRDNIRSVHEIFTFLRWKGQSDFLGQAGNKDDASLEIRYEHLPEAFALGRQRGTCRLGGCIVVVGTKDCAEDYCTYDEENDGPSTEPVTGRWDLVLGGRVRRWKDVPYPLFGVIL